MNIWWIVGLSVCTVLTAILVFRVHAFLTLLLAGLLVATLTGQSALQTYASQQVDAKKMTSAQAESFVAKSTPAGRLAVEFGVTAGKIGILIALASIIGQCLLESGGAATIVDRMLKLTGPRFAPEAMAASSFVLGIPVFFDTVFYLMVPLARSLREKVGKNYTLFILAILAGGSLAHSLIPPTPGPLLVAEKLNIELGVMLTAGFAICICSSVVALVAARIINHFIDVPLRSVEGPSETRQLAGQADDAAKPDLMSALLPIAIPVVLITVASVFKIATKPEAGAQPVEPSILSNVILFLGDKNVALGIGAILAMRLALFIPKGKRESIITRSLASGGIIILITAAGGAFGAMLRQAGIGGAIESLTGDVRPLWILPIAFAVTATIRTLQGSATVAMITAVGIFQGFADAGTLPFHPVYLAMAIGSGSKPVSWMTDSAFWVITRMSGMTESEGLKTLAPMSSSMGIAGLFFTLLFAYLFPCV